MGNSLVSIKFGKMHGSPLVLVKFKFGDLNAYHYNYSLKHGVQF